MFMMCLWYIMICSVMFMMCLWSYMILYDLNQGKTPAQKAKAKKAKAKREKNRAKGKKKGVENCEIYDLFYDILWCFVMLFMMW